MKSQTQNKNVPAAASASPECQCGSKIPRAAVVLSGCGVYDGSEIHEAVITILNLQRRGADISFFAPDAMQAETLNHIDGTAMGTPRNILVESARIARGKIEALSKFSASAFDMLIFPGGFGAAKNLCSFAFDGADCKVNKDVESAVIAAMTKGLPIGFLCISPVVCAKIVGKGVKLTIGNDPETAQALENMGAVHVDCPADSFVEDTDFNIFSSPAYMLARGIDEIDRGVGAMIGAMIKK